MSLRGCSVLMHGIMQSVHCILDQLRPELGTGGVGWFLPQTKALVSFRHETAPTATSVWMRSISKGWETLWKRVRASVRAVAPSGAALKSGWPHVRANDVLGETARSLGIQGSGEMTAW